MTAAERHRIIIVGGGFGGLYAARSLRDAPVDVTLVDRKNHHLFQPLLYQVATGELSPADIAAPLRSILGRQSNAQVVLDEVQGLDVARRRVLLREGTLSYDSLVVAAGSTHSYFGHPEWARYAPGLKTLEDGAAIRRRIFLAFEAAERETDPQARQAWLTFVIVGGGPTGVELAGALAEIARQTVSDEFRTIDPADATVVLADADARILTAYSEQLSRRAAEKLERLGVRLELESRVTGVDAEGVTCSRGDATDRFRARTVLWAAGVQPSPLARTLAAATGSGVDDGGRIVVGPELSLPDHPEIFVVGDMAHVEQDGGAVPGLAPAAMQEGRYAADAIVHRLRGEPVAPFRYHDRGSLAVIGRGYAVAQLPHIRLAGRFAWFLWGLVHLFGLIQFEKRLVVFIQWVWTYATHNRANRLILGEPDTDH